MSYNTLSHYARSTPLVSKMAISYIFINFKILFHLMPESESGFEVVWRKGAIHIIYLTGAQENIRFKDLKEHLDISDPTISTRLDELEEAGLVERTFFDEMPPRVEYSLTPPAEELYELLIPLFEWVSEQYEKETADPVDNISQAECR